MPILDPVPGWQLFVDWNNDGFSGVMTDWALGDDISGYVKAIQVEIGQVDPQANVSEIATADFVLNNSSRIFSPENLSSPLHNRLVPRLPVFLASTYGNMVDRLFYGYIQRIDPASGTRGSREVMLSCVGAAQVIQDTKLDFPLVTNASADQLIRHIINYAFGANFAESRMDFIANPANNDRWVVNDVTYTFKTALTPAAGEILIGATRYDTLENFGAALNNESGAGTVYAASTPTPSLVRAERNASYYQLTKDYAATRYYRLGEFAGTNCDDLGTNSADGTYVNTPTLNTDGALTGDVDTSVLFDGVNDYVSCPALYVSGSFSLECWVKPVSLAAVGCAIAIVGGGATRNEADILINTNGSVSFSFSTEALTTAASQVAVGSWYHIVCTYDSILDLSSIYINGVLKTTGSAGPFQGTGAPSVTLGCTAPGFGHISAYLDEAAIYLSLLSAEQVAAHYASAIMPPGITFVSVLPGAYGNTIPINKLARTLRGGYSTEVFADYPDRYYRMGDTDATCRDRTVYRQHGTYTGTTNSQTGALNRDNDYSVFFDGINDKATVPSYAFLNRSFTIEAWIKPSNPSVATDNCIFSAFTAYLSKQAIYWRVYNPTGIMEFNFYTSGIATVAGVVTFNAWNHVVATYDYPTTTLKLYANGLLVASGSVGPFLGAAPICEFGAFSTNAEWFTGYVDEGAIYPTVLSLDRIFTHYKRGLAHTLFGGVDASNGWIVTPYAELVKADGAFAYWRMDERSGVLTDNIGLKSATPFGYPGYLARGPLAGDPNPGLYLNGSTDYLSLPPISVAARDYSIELWFFVAEMPASSAYLVHIHNASSANNSLSLQLLSTGAIRVDYFSDALTTAAGLVSVNNWYHLVVTYWFGGDTTRIHLNGVDVGSSAAGPLTNPPTLTTVGASVFNTLNFSGVIDELAFYYNIMPPLTALKHYQTGIDRFAAYFISLQVGNTIDYAGDTWQSGNTNGISAIEQIMDTERGWFFEGKGGQLDLRNRGDRYWRAAETPALIIDNTADIRGAVDIDQIFNHVTAEITPRAALTTGIVAKAASTLTIPGKGSITIRLNFIDPSTGSPMSATRVDMPTPVTDFQAGEVTAGDNGGFYNNYNWIKIAIAPRGTFAEITITNKATGPLKIFNLQFPGAGLVRYNPIIVVRDDYDSIAMFRTRSLALRFPLTTDFSFAEAFTYDMINRLSVPTYRVEAIEFGAARLCAGVRVHSLNMGNIIQISESQIGVTGLRHEVIGLKYSLNVERELETTVSVRRVDDSNYLLLNSQARSLLDGSLKIGV